MKIQINALFLKISFFVTSTETEAMTEVDSVVILGNERALCGMFCNAKEYYIIMELLIL
jgi:hypothetical protein